MNSHSLNVRERLAVSPARGLGTANEVAAEAAEDASTLRELIGALKDPNEVVQRRASNALKKLQALAPGVLQPFAARLVRQALACTVLEARWNLTIVVGGLRLQKRDRALAMELMIEGLGSESAFLCVFALQGLTGLSAGDRALRARVRVFIARAVNDPSAAVRARARKLQRTLDKS